MYIVKEENEYKILKVPPEQEQGFQKEFEKLIVTQGKDLGELINNFQNLQTERLPINNMIMSFRKQDNRGENETLHQRPKLRL